MRSECIALFFSLLGVAACGSSVDDGSSTGAIEETPACGGLSGKSCPTGQACVDDPADDCDPANGGADCPGICVIPQGSKSSCGGFAGTACPTGEQCVDDPSDNCDPNNGGADCPGICVPATVQCAELDVCACQATAGCQASFDGCHCPSDYGCDPQVECFCGGGAYLGCSAAAAH